MEVAVSEPVKPNRGVHALAWILIVLGLLQAGMCLASMLVTWGEPRATMLYFDNSGINQGNGGGEMVQGLAPRTLALNTFFGSILAGVGILFRRRSFSLARLFVLLLIAAGLAALPATGMHLRESESTVSYTFNRGLTGDEFDKFETMVRGAVQPQTASRRVTALSITPNSSGTRIVVEARYDPMLEHEQLMAIYEVLKASTLTAGKNLTDQRLVVEK